MQGKLLNAVFTYSTQICSTVASSAKGVGYEFRSVCYGVTLADCVVTCKIWGELGGHAFLSWKCDLLHAGLDVAV
jgi:hypothetical protein